LQAHALKEARGSQISAGSLFRHKSINPVYAAHPAAIDNIVLGWPEVRPKVMTDMQHQQEVDVIRRGVVGHKAAIDDQGPHEARRSRFGQEGLKFLIKARPMIRALKASKSLADLFHRATVDACWQKSQVIQRRNRHVYSLRRFCDQRGPISLVL
jgi:hypothetical protein